MKVYKQVLVSFFIGRYNDEVSCDVVPMHSCHLLLGRPWYFDKKKVIHDEFKNRYYFIKDGKFITFIPLSLKNIDENQLKLKRESEAKGVKIKI